MSDLYLHSSQMNYGAITEPINPSAAAHLAPRVTMSDDLYRELAELARIEADMTDGDSAKIVVEAERDGYTHILHLDCLLTFDVDYSPCGRPLVYLHRITPTWIHCETYDQFGEQRANDFDIKILKKLL